MNFTLYLLGREVLSVSLELPETPQISDLSSLLLAGPEEAEVEDDEDLEYEEPESLQRRVRGQRAGF